MPVYVQMTEITGMLIDGKMSLGALIIERIPPIRMKMARTINVYGRRNAKLTIHMVRKGVQGVAGVQELRFKPDWR
jgi:hypothetical protein